MLLTRDLGLLPRLWLKRKVLFLTQNPITYSDVNGMFEASKDGGIRGRGDPPRGMLASIASSKYIYITQILGIVYHHVMLDC